jgi:hypothetical protein
MQNKGVRQIRTGALLAFGALSCIVLKIATKAATRRAAALVAGADGYLFQGGPTKALWNAILKTD